MPIVGKDSVQIRAFAPLGIEIVGIELADPFEHELVVRTHQVAVSAMAVSGVKRVVAEHVLRFFGQVSAGDLVDVFVMTEGKVNAIETAIGLINAVPGLERRILSVRIGNEEFGKNDFAGVGTTDRESVSDDGPLRLAIKAENLAKVVQESGEDKPARMTVLADGFGGLEEMFKLGKVRIGIAVVDQSIEVVDHVPNALLTATQAAILGLFPENKVESLVGVIFAVEAGNAGIGIGVVVAELVFGFVLTIASGDKVVPVVELAHGSVIGGRPHGQIMKRREAKFNRLSPTFGSCKQKSLVDVAGIEPATPCLQSRCSPS